MLRYADCTAFRKSCRVMRASTCVDGNTFGGRVVVDVEGKVAQIGVIVIESHISVLSSFSGCKAVYSNGLCRQDGVVVFDDDRNVEEAASCVCACEGERAAALLCKG